MIRISAIIITKNEELNLERCLKSLVNIDEIVIGDSQSTDRTLEIAQKFTDKYYSVQWKGYGPTKQELIAKTSNSWILWIDADEELSPGLIREISKLDPNNQSAAAYKVPRKVKYLGKWIRHSGWYPGYVTRLFDKHKVRFTDTQLHERLEVDGPTQKLRYPILHYPYPNLNEHLKKIDHYTTLFAKHQKVKGKKVSWFGLIVRPSIRFVKTYLIQFGFLDGIQGLIISILGSYYIFLKYLKLWELNHQK
ncbi:glycosyltransferase family 2 protein [bacterium]|nr:glycosyltransferase family 2 protein [bacterium]